MDLAAAYGVLTKALNQAVKRNRGRFPADFVFRLNAAEAKRARRSRSQTVTLKRGENVKYLPWAFTEHGAVMAASVLNSPRAVEMSVFVIRAFIRLRAYARGHAEIAKRLDVLERRVTDHDDDRRNVQLAPQASDAVAAKPARNRLCKEVMARGAPSGASIAIECKRRFA
jgi:hypothetical protein